MTAKRPILLRKSTRNVYPASTDIPGILLLEDNDSDAELLTRELRRTGLDFDIQRVETRDDYVRALREQKPSLIISDYTLPGFDGLSALGFARQTLPASPFIFVSGTIAEA